MTSADGTEAERSGGSTGPSRKDVAEFYRLALAIGLSTPSDVVAWADAIVSAEEHPEGVFLDLCCCRRSPLSSVRSWLHDVPGIVTDELPMRLLLGHANQLLASATIAGPDLLRRLYSVTRVEDSPTEVTNEITQLEDALRLAEDGVYGTLPDVARDLRELLARYVRYSPPNLESPVEVPPSR